jgi:hypothetical protein
VCSHWLSSSSGFRCAKALRPICLKPFLATQARSLGADNWKRGLAGFERGQLDLFLQVYRGSRLGLGFCNFPPF